MRIPGLSGSESEIEIWATRHMRRRRASRPHGAPMSYKLLLLIALFLPILLVAAGRGAHVVGRSKLQARAPPPPPGRGFPPPLAGVQSPNRDCRAPWKPKPP